jgi:hypothetical protein
VQAVPAETEAEKAGPKKQGRKSGVGKAGPKKQAEFAGL